MKLAIVGAGKMGGSVMEGALAAKMLAPEDIAIFEPYDVRAEQLMRDFGVTRITDPAKLADAERILISVKPQVFADVAPLLKGKDQLLISLMAGVPLARISELSSNKRVVRVMPNLGASVGESATALCHMNNSHIDGVKETDLEFASQLFEAVGTVYPMQEKLLDAFTGIAGSGPSFVAVIAEALADGAVKVGFPRDVATDLSRQVLLASAKLLESRSPEQLKAEVCSAGGTSITGVAALEKNGVRHACIDAVEQATNRSIELGKL